MHRVVERNTELQVPFTPPFTPREKMQNLKGVALNYKTVPMDPFK